MSIIIVQKDAASGYCSAFESAMTDVAHKLHIQGIARVDMKLDTDKVVTYCFGIDSDGAWDMNIAELVIQGELGWRGLVDKCKTVQADEEYVVFNVLSPASAEFDLWKWV